MEGYINENRWIDLSGLPRTKNDKYIDWQKSIGLKVPFQFDSVTGIIKLVARDKRGKIFITIDKYVDEPIKIGTNWLIYCWLYRLVGNRVADVRPDLVRYFVNLSDAYRYSAYNKALVEVICPICKRKKLQRVNNLCSQGFFCDMCSDGVSLPNKIMYCILEQCKINFINEASKAKGFDWIVKQYRYDFYFQTSNGKHVLIEMDGGFHRKEDQQLIDNEKNDLAKNNGYELIRIDCQYNGDPLDYIKPNILNSELKNILPLHIVNWDLCRQFLKTSFMQDACKLWEVNEYSVGEIAKKLNVSNMTVITYLKRGKEFGLCPSYDSSESIYRKGTRVALLQQNKIIHVFRHFNQLCEQSSGLIGVHFNKSSVIDCSRRSGFYKGFEIKRITKEEYEQYKMIENKNNEVVKEEDIYDKSSSN